MIDKKNKTRRQKQWEEKYPGGKSWFSWTFSDYKVWDLKPPECIIQNPDITEGELLIEEEIKNWYIDSIQVMVVLKGEDQKVYRRVHQDFILDLKYLFSLGKISKEDLEFALDESNFG